MEKDGMDINQCIDMKYEIGLLDDKGRINKGVVHRVNEDRSGIYLEEFELEGLKLHVEDILSYKPWNYGRVHKGSGQLGVYKLKSQEGKIYFAMIKDYIAYEGDWRIMLVNIRDSEQAIKSWLMTNRTYGIALADYARGVTTK